MSYIRNIIVIVFLLVLSSFKMSSEFQRIVYTCTNTEVKCYVLENCDNLIQKCNVFRGKMYKMREQEAKNLGKVLCNCNDIK